MLLLFHGINDMVGWYSTGPELRDNDLDVQAQFCQYAPNPVLVVIDVGLGIPTNAYYTMSSLEKIEKEVFVRASLEIPPHEVKEDSGEEHLLREFKDTTTETAPKRMTLGGVSFVDAMESYMEFYKNQVRISVEGYDISLRAVDLDISLVNHFSSCGNVEFVKVPRDPVTNAINGTSTTVVLRGKGAAEKALALNGSDVGGWRASVKILPPALSSLRSGLTTREAARQYVAHFKRYKSRVITVKGYDYSLCEADVKRALVNYFSSCGETNNNLFGQSSYLENQSLFGQPQNFSHVPGANHDEKMMVENQMIDQPLDSFSSLMQMDVQDDHNSLPLLAAASPEEFKQSQMMIKNKDIVHRHDTSNPSSSNSSFTQDHHQPWCDTIDDEAGDSYWKEIME
ncbi:hypothetical protein F2Q70_00007518 [Brassica cretica]|uniref:RRM domain-containing protein n=1 Tax=Brassica cretica TaxID=69181 RepID=A0A8S9MC35_BRACR|nr:hypothetical protein F2Q70_00007518 [Brassica cretica]